MNRIVKKVLALILGFFTFVVSFMGMSVVSRAEEPFHRGGCTCKNHYYVESYDESTKMYHVIYYVNDEYSRDINDNGGSLTHLLNPLFEVHKTYHEHDSTPCSLCYFGEPPVDPTPSVEPKNEASSMTAEEIAEQRAEAEQKAVEEKIAEEKALPVTSFTSTESVNSMPEAAKSTGASYNLTKVTTTQGFASAVEKIAASAKSQNTNNRRNASVTVYSDRPMTFSADILDAVSAADVDFSYIFRHGGKLYRITIPRGAKVDLGGKKFEGPLFIGRLLGTTQEIE